MVGQVDALTGFALLTYGSFVLKVDPKPFSLQFMRLTG